MYSRARSVAIVSSASSALEDEGRILGVLRYARNFAFGKKIALAELYEKYESSRNFGRSCQDLLLSFPHAYPLNTLRIPPDPVPWASWVRVGPGRCCWTGGFRCKW
jgi:hypothetical protein